MDLLEAGREPLFQNPARPPALLQLWVCRILAHRIFLPVKSFQLSDTLFFALGQGESIFDRCVPYRYIKVSKTRRASV